MKEEIKEICTELNDGKIAVVQATEKLLDLFSVRGSFTAEQVKQAYNDGFSDSVGSKDFDIDNYR